MLIELHATRTSIVVVILLIVFTNGHDIDSYDCTPYILLFGRTMDHSQLKLNNRGYICCWWSFNLSLLYQSPISTHQLLKIFGSENSAYGLHRTPFWWTSPNLICIMVAFLVNINGLMVVPTLYWFMSRKCLHVIHPNLLLFLLAGCRFRTIWAVILFAKGNWWWWWWCDNMKPARSSW